MFRNLARVRTGKASTTILDDIRVMCYGAPTLLNQVASIYSPNPQLITIEPYDKNIINDVEKAIVQANLGLDPVNDGHIIKLSIPKLFDERRKELVRITRQIAETGKIIIRGHRNNINKMLKKLEKNREISKDNYHQALKEVQKQTDEGIKEIDKMLEEKEKKLLEI